MSVLSPSSSRMPKVNRRFRFVGYVLVCFIIWYAFSALIAPPSTTTHLAVQRSVAAGPCADVSLDFAIEGFYDLKQDDRVKIIMRLIEQRQHNLPCG